MRKKFPRVTNSQQMVASEILIRYFFEEDKDKFVEWVKETYCLMTDPFTSLPCSCKEYAENSLEYAKQSMIEKYGHCDGLD